MNDFIQNHYLQVSTSKITGNHPHYKTIIDPPPSIAHYSNPTTKPLNNEPFCFVSESDSQLYIIYTGANRVIINDTNLLSLFIASTDGVKEIGGNPVQIQGRGKLHISLLPDSGKKIHVTEMENSDHPSTL